MPVPKYILSAVFEQVIEGYRRDKKLPVIPGKIWAEKPSWMVQIQRLVDEDKRSELSRLAFITADGNKTSIENIGRAFDQATPLVDLREAFSDVARIPDRDRANVDAAIRAAQDAAGD